MVGSISLQTEYHLSKVVLLVAEVLCEVTPVILCACSIKIALSLHYCSCFIATTAKCNLCVVFNKHHLLLSIFSITLFAYCVYMATALQVTRSCNGALFVSAFLQECAALFVLNECNCSSKLIESTDL